MTSAGNSLPSLQSPTIESPGLDGSAIEVPQILIASRHLALSQPTPAVASRTAAHQFLAPVAV